MLDRYLAVKGSREPPFIDPTSKYDRRAPLELPFQWEEKPRDRERKQPSVVKLDTAEIRMDIDDDSSEIEERDKGRDGVTSKNQPKVFIKAKKSQWLGTDFAEMQQDSSSYSMGVTTYEQQAKKEPDFIGNAFYYNLTKTTLFPDLAGEYIILYTRPVGAVFDGHAQSTIVSPSTENRITIATEPPAGRSSIGRIFQHAFQEGYWAAGTFVFEGMHCVLRCERLPENVARSNRNSAHVKTELTRLEPATDNMVFGGRRPRDAGASISFGMKVMSEGWCESRERHVFYGFHFLKIEIPIHSPAFGTAERQLIVAAKIPRQGDIASAFILKQELLNIRDIRILQSDLRARSMADWHTYALTERFYDPIPSHGWTPRFPANLGMQDNHFNAARFEQHLQSVDNPILELCNLTAWISRFTPGRPVGHVQRSIHDARYYMENRYRSMLGELRLRQAAGFRHESLPTVFEELTDDDGEEDYEDAMIGVSKRGRTSEIETVTPLRRVINRGFGRGGKVPSTSVSKMGRERRDEFQF